MARRGDSKRDLLDALLAASAPGYIDEVAWNELRARLSPISDSYLRQLLKQTHIPLAPLVEGVTLATPEDAERTLRALAHEYVRAADSARKRTIRERVIEAKDRARWSHKDEMLLWTMTWLENPESFPVWLDLRKRALTVT